MSRDKRKGFIAGYKKAGPTTRISIIIACIAILLGALYFCVQLWMGATKGDLREAQGDREEKYRKQLERIDEVKEIVESRQIMPVHRDSSPAYPKVYQIDESRGATQEPLNQKKDHIIEANQSYHSIVFIDVNSNRDGADILINDTLKCRAPCSINVKHGVYNLKVIDFDILTGYKWVHDRSLNVSGPLTLFLTNNDFSKRKIGE